MISLIHPAMVVLKQYSGYFDIVVVQHTKFLDLFLTFDVNINILCLVLLVDLKPVVL